MEQQVATKPSHKAKSSSNHQEPSKISQAAAEIQHYINGYWASYQAPIRIPQPFNRFISRYAIPPSELEFYMVANKMCTVIIAERGRWVFPMPKDAGITHDEMNTIATIHSSILDEKRRKAWRDREAMKKARGDY